MQAIVLDPHSEYAGGALKKRPRDPDVDRLLDELRAWCAEKYGRQTELARYLKIDNRRVHDWLSGRLTPSLAMGIKLQEFLKKQKPARKSGP